jgi:intracellular sulfur oxidation DsrE/DsrF family protein
LNRVEPVPPGARSTIADQLQPTDEIIMTKKPFSAAQSIAALAFVALQAIALPSFAQVGDGTAESLKPPLQIANQSGLKVVIQVNYASTLPNGIGEQVLAAKNLFDQYEALGMKPGKDYEIVMVFRANGAQFLLTDDAYDAKVKQPHPKGNPSRPMLDALSKAGVKMYECGVAMRLKGYTPQDILPNSRIVVSGIGALVDLAKSSYIEITP